MTNNNTLIIADCHFPFHHRNYLGFLKQVQKDYDCTRVCHVGDIVDNHSISFHDHDPDGMSPKEELELCRKIIKEWAKAFPRMDCAIGNHDELHRRKAYADGVPVGYLRSFAEAYEVKQAGADWRFNFEFRYGSGERRWRLTHGTGTSGHDAAFKSAVSSRISTAQGHIHTAFGVKYHASSNDILWGMQVGCGINRKAYAYNYGRDFKDKPVLGCGVVVEDGRLPIAIPMPM